MIKTFSIFYYDYIVNINSRYLNFDEGSGELSAEIDLGAFAPSELPAKVADAMNAVGSQTYNVSFNRADRSFTISSPDGTFDLLVDTGSQSSSSIFPVIGFTGSDRTGQSSYTGGTSGDKYEPQFKLQDFVEGRNNQEAVDGVINESTSGVLESIRFGNRKIIEANIRYITDLPMDGKVIKNNPNGVADARRFLEYITKKRRFEFMPDISDRNTFNVVVLESTQSSRDGTGFKLRERISDNLPDYYDTGVFRMRFWRRHGGLYCQSKMVKRVMRPPLTRALCLVRWTITLPAKRI